MIFKNIKLYIGIIALLAYISIGVFGLVRLTHLPETPMINCPYAENGFSVCNNGFDHINNWQEFSSITFPALFILLLMVLGLVLYFFDRQNLLNKNRYFYKWRFDFYDEKLHTLSQEIIKWLSLFENSPSLAYKTQL